MVKFTCFSALLQKKKSKIGYSKRVVADDPDETLQVKLDKVDNSSAFHVSVVPFSTKKNSTYEVKLVRDMNCSPDDSERRATKLEANGKDETIHDVAYEGGDEEESPLSTGGSSDVDHQMYDVIMSNSQGDLSVLDSVPLDSATKSSVDQAIQSGHLSDPGEYVRTDFVGSTIPSSKFKRSCSNLEMNLLNKMKSSGFSSRTKSFDNLQAISHRRNAGRIHGIEGSPLSVMSSNSADKVMLKRLSSSQLLPSRSRKIWWKFFLWSQRNLHRAAPKLSKAPQLGINDDSTQKEGYSSDTIDVCWRMTGNESMIAENSELNSLSNRTSEGFPCNQWMAFSTQPSSHSWIDEWVNSIDAGNVLYSEDVEGSVQNDESKEVFTPSSEISESLEICTHTQRRSSVPSGVLHASKIIETMNPLSTVAHVSGMGLKIIPNFSPFCSLKTINLSNNFIVHIAPGSLPKVLQALNLSRNKIVTIEGLRELTRLRVLDLSYNRISRIGHGLSNCTIIKELYLAGNKISDVESLHRLLKLTVLDLSFNKITTTKALGQLVANYSTLAALNLLGNPVQTNVGEDQLRKALSSLLPQLAYLNKQPIKPMRAREAAIDSVAKAALGDSGWSSRRRSLRRSSQGSSSFKGGATSQRASSRRGRAGELSKHHCCDKIRVGHERSSMKR